MNRVKKVCNRKTGSTGSTGSNVVYGEMEAKMDREQAKEKIDALIASAKNSDPTLFECRDAVVRRVAGEYVKPPFKGQEARIFWELMSEVERMVRNLRELGLRDEVIERIMGVKK